MVRLSFSCDFPTEQFPHFELPPLYVAVNGALNTADIFSPISSDVIGLVNERQHPVKVIVCLALQL